MAAPAPLPGALSVALKEWAVAVQALASGRQCLLLRKGGIAEARAGFAAAHRDFFFYPTTEHQRPEALKEPYRAAAAGVVPEPHAPGQEIVFTTLARVTDVHELTDRRATDALADEHVMSAEAVAQRWDYKPERPLFLLLLRIYALAAPCRVPFLPRYAGCRSWVPLEEPIAVPSMAPVLDDVTFDARRRRILGAAGFA
jgi:hypothetical protein